MHFLTAVFLLQVEEDFVLDVEKEKFAEELQAIVKKAQENLQTHSLVFLLIALALVFSSYFSNLSLIKHK